MALTLWEGKGMVSEGDETQSEPEGEGEVRGMVGTKEAQHQQDGKVWGVACGIVVLKTIR